MSRRRAALQATTIIGVMGGIITLAIQVDSYLIERRQKIAQLTFEEAVRDCELGGGKWWRGDCLYKEAP